MRRFLKEVSIFKALNDVRGPMRVGLLQHRLNLDLAVGYHNSFLFKSALYKNAADSNSTFDGIPGRSPTGSTTARAPTTVVTMWGLVDRTAGRKRY